MNSALGIVIGLAVLSCIFWILGAGVCRLMGRKEEPGFLWLFGMALFLGIFSVVDIFTEAGGAAFHVLFYTALAVLVIAVALGVVYLVRAGRKEGGSWMRYPARDVWLLLFLVLLVVQIWYGMGNQLYVSRYDTSYYNGNAINALYTDTMYQYDAYTGVYVGKAVAWHDSYSMLIAFLAKLFFMHPLVVVNRIMGVIEIVAANLAVYEIALRLSKGNRAVAVWTAIHRALHSVLCWNLGEIPGYYYGRAWQSRNHAGECISSACAACHCAGGGGDGEKAVLDHARCLCVRRGDDVDEWRVHDTDAFGCRTPPSAASQEEVKILGICGAVGAAVSGCRCAEFSVG